MRTERKIDCDLMHPRSMGIYCKPIDKLIREYDGVIAEVRAETYDTYKRFRRPLVVVGPEGLHLKKPWVGPDYIAMTDHLFETILDRGYRHIAYFHTERFALPVSTTIRNRLAELCRENGLALEVFFHDVIRSEVDEFSGEDQIIELSQFLRSMPKPCVLLTPDDHCGWRAIEACRIAKIAVPSQVSVIGVRSDDFICEFCNPPLSHVYVDYKQIGQVAARLIRLLIDGGEAPVHTYVGHGQLRDRESSSLSAHDDPLISKMLCYIENHLHEAISIEDIARAVAVSDRTLQRNSLKILGKNPARVLREHRLNRAKKLLANSSLPLVEVASQCGLSEQSQLNRMIKEETGLTPTALRGAHSF